MAEPVGSTLDARVGAKQFVYEDIGGLERQQFGWEMRRTAQNENNSRITDSQNRKGTGKR